MSSDALAKVRAILVQAYGGNLDGSDRGPLVSTTYLAQIRDVVRDLAPDAEAREDMTWRVGRKLGRTLYEGETLIGMMDTPELARIVVDAVNARAGGRS